MIRRRTLLSTALAATAAIGLAACSKDDSGSSASDGGSDGGGAAALSGVDVSDDLGSEPTVSFTAPLSIDAADARVIAAGDGATLAEGDTVIMRSMYVDASTGETLQSWWQGAPAGGLQVTSDGLGAEAFAFFQTVTVGSRFAMAGWQQDSSGNAVSLVQVGDVDRVVSPLRAEGAEQKPSGSYPKVTLGKDGAPAIDGPGSGDAPAKTVREVLIEGTGDTTRKGDYLTMHYTGWAWETGEQFDSSWERGAPFSFVQGQGQVISGWDDNLLDLKVGSQVMLVIPGDEAYPADSGSELAGQTLIFVVDVLDAAHTNA
ncbi:FKBP-type peptidyl-prolyl cis-trans isomerase [Brachybacterium horti]